MSSDHQNINSLAQDVLSGHRHLWRQVGRTVQITSIQVLGASGQCTPALHELADECRCRCLLLHPCLHPTQLNNSAALVASASVAATYTGTAVTYSDIKVCWHPQQSCPQDCSVWQVLVDFCKGHGDKRQVVSFISPSILFIFLRLCKLKLINTDMTSKLFGMMSIANVLSKLNSMQALMLAKWLANLSEWAD